MAVQPNVDNKKDCFLFLQDRISSKLPYFRPTDHPSHTINCILFGLFTKLFLFFFLQPVAHLKLRSCFHIILVSFLDHCYYQIFSANKLYLYVYRNTSVVRDTSVCCSIKVVFFKLVLLLNVIFSSNV